MSAILSYSMKFSRVLRNSFFKAPEMLSFSVLKVKRLDPRPEMVQVELKSSGSVRSGIIADYIIRFLKRRARPQPILKPLPISTGYKLASSLLCDVAWKWPTLSSSKSFIQHVTA